MRVLVAVDGSEYSLRAVEFAARLAKESNSALAVIHVVPHVKSTKEDLITLMKEELGNIRKAGEKYLERAREEAREHGVSPELILKEGDPVELILETAGDYDLIVAGTKGKGRVEKLILGSVSSALVDRSPAPVTVVR
ncbi:MAG: universal stress protein [Euryarchaeota archaeon]|nr:universal stress protein [Euryarchaeota archaeon]